MNIEEAKKQTYGRHDDAYVEGRCVESVYQSIWSSTSQCSRKNGYGEGGLYCKQHDPVEIKKKEEAKYAEYKLKLKENKKKWMGIKFYNVLKQIAEGHNDPRSIAIEILEEYEKD